MDHSEIRLLPMTDEMYRSYAREYENDPDLYLPGQIYTHYVYSEERVEQYLKRQKDLKPAVFIAEFAKTGKKEISLS